MSYIPTNWKSGDTVTSEKLNKLENGVANNDLFIVNFVLENFINDEEINTGNGTSDKTIAQIIQAYQDGKRIVGQTAINREGIGTSVLLFNFAGYMGQGALENVSFNLISSYVVVDIYIINDGEHGEMCQWSRFILPQQ